MSNQLTQNDLRKYCVTYNGDSVEKVRAAYFVQDGDLISFKNHDHKVVMAARRDMVVSVRDTTDEEPIASQTNPSNADMICSACGGPMWCDHGKAAS